MKLNRGQMDFDKLLGKSVKVGKDQKLVKNFGTHVSFPNRLDAYVI